MGFLHAGAMAGVLLAFGAPALSAADSPNLLVNGSFEQPGNDWWVGLPKGSTFITGWTITRDTVDYTTGTYPCSDGKFCLDLDGTPGFGAIAQTFATVSGGAYNVTFDLAGNPDGLPVVKQLRVQAAGQQTDFSFDTTGRSRSNVGWTTKSWSFTATSTQTTLEFSSLDTVNGWAGPLLDNVRVTAAAPPAGCTYSIAPPSASAPAAGTTGTVAVTAASGCSWTATSNVAWITITTSASGTGNGTAAYAVAANPGVASRTGTLAIAGQTFTVTQVGAAAACTYAISPTSASVPAAGTTGTVVVTAASGCSWTATSSVTWITITTGASGTGNGTAAYAVAANAGVASRTSVLTIAGQTFTVTQAGAAAVPGPLPAISSGGVVNGADFTANFSPGILVSIFGTNLAPGTDKATRVPMPDTLLGVSVEITDGGRIIKAPLFFVSPQQINAVLPYQLVNPAVDVRVRGPAGAGNSVTIPVQGRCPRLLTTTMDGKGQPILVHANYRLVTASDPATPGEVVMLYLTGLGAVEPAIAAGTAGGDGSSGNPLNRVSQPVEVLVNGVAATVTFAGLAPGYPGLYQVNFEMPRTLRSGMAGLSIRLEERESQRGVAFAAAGAAWQQVAAVAAGPAGATLAGDRVTLTVPPGSLTGATELRLHRAAGGGAAYGLSGLPETTSGPMTIEFTPPGPLPSGDTYVVLEEAGENGGALYLKGSVTGGRVAFTIPPRKSAPRSTLRIAASEGKRLAGTDVAGPVVDASFWFSSGISSLRTIGYQIEILWESQVDRDLISAVAARLDAAYYALRTSYMVPEGLQSDSISVFVGQYNRELLEPWGESVRSSWTKDPALKLDVDYVYKPKDPKQPPTQDVLLSRAAHLLFHAVAEGWEPDGGGRGSPSANRWLWMDEASACLFERLTLPTNQGHLPEGTSPPGLLRDGAGLEFVAGPGEASKALEHGRKAYWFVEYLNRHQSLGRGGELFTLWELYSARRYAGIDSPLKALETKGVALRQAWLDFCKRYVEGDIFPITSYLWLGTLVGMMEVLQEPTANPDKVSRSTIVPMGDLSAYSFYVKFSNKPNQLTASLNVDIAGNSDTVVYAYSVDEDRRRVSLISGPAPQVRITSVNRIYENRQSLLIVVVNPRARYGYNTVTPTLIEIKLDDPTQLEVVRKGTEVSVSYSAKFVCSETRYTQCPPTVAFWSTPASIRVPLVWTTTGFTGNSQDGNAASENQHDIRFSGEFSADGRMLTRFTVSSTMRYRNEETKVGFTLTNLPFVRQYLLSTDKDAYLYQVTGPDTRNHVSPLIWEERNGERRTVISAVNWDDPGYPSISFSVAVPK